MKHSMDRNRHLVGAVAAVMALACFGAALGFPAIGTCPSASFCASPNWFDNQNILFFGWLALFVGQFGWFANIPLVLNILSLFRGFIPSLWLVASEALLVAIAVISLQPRLGMRLPHHEAYDEAIGFLGTGFWLWVVAHMITVIVAIALRCGMTHTAESDC